MSAATTAQAGIIKLQIMALNRPTLSDLALLIEAIESHVEHAPIPSQEHDVYWYLNHARGEAEYVPATEEEAA